MRKISLVLLILLSLGCSSKHLGEPDVKKEAYKFKYKVSSYEWNHTKTRLDIPAILYGFGYESDDIGNVSPTIAIADFNLDGNLDFQIQYNPGKSDITPIEYHFFIFDPKTKTYIKNVYDFSFSSVKSLQGRRTIVGDFNDDKKADVIRGAGAHGLADERGYDYPTIMLSNSTGYEVKQIIGAPLSNFHTVSSGDIDNDGDLDTFWGENAENDGFAINNGDGTFVWNSIQDRVLNMPRVVYGIWISEMFDINKDSNIDLIIAGGYACDGCLDGITVLYGDGTGYFDYSKRVVVQNQISTQEHAIGFGDVDKDGDIDIFALSGINDRGLYTSYENIDNQFTDSTDKWFEDSILPENSYNLTSIIVKDLNKNGYLDITEEETAYREVGYDRKAYYFEWNGSKFTKK